MRTASPYNPARKALVEPVQQPLYSSVSITGASPEAQLLFFQATQGSSGENPVQTNMETAGQLSNPKIFVVRGVRIHIAQNVAILATNVNPADDLIDIIESYWYRLFIGTKEYLRVPVFYLASGLGIWFSAAAAGAEATDEIAQVAALGAPRAKLPGEKTPS